MNSNSKSFELSLTDINQLWVADLTHIRLLRKFIYLAAILDAHSRRCMGWVLPHKSDAQWMIKALEMALMSREIAPARVHLSDPRAVCLARAPGDITPAANPNP